MGVERALVPVERIERSILVIRGQRVMMDSDLAELYGVRTGALNRAVKRNASRFPADFTFLLTGKEASDLKCQIGTSSWGGARKLPRAFTEHGAIMAAMVLNSPRATEASVYVVRAFVKLKDTLGEHKELAAKLAELDRKVATHDIAIREIVQAIQRLAALPPPGPDEPEEREPDKPPIGFRVRETAAPYRRIRPRALPQ